MYKKVWKKLLFYYSKPVVSLSFLLLSSSLSLSWTTIFPPEQNVSLAKPVKADSDDSEWNFIPGVVTSIQQNFQEEVENYDPTTRASGEAEYEYVVIPYAH